MGSLRDQLVAKGAASKKDAQRVQRELKEQRRAEQAHRERKHVVEKREAAAAEAERREREQRLIAERRAHREATEAEERVRSVQRILLANRVRDRGKQAFFHRSLDGRRVVRRQVSERVAFALRCGQLAIAGHVGAQGEEYHVINLEAARRVAELRPEAVVHFVTDTTGISDPAEGFWQPEEEIALSAHRVDEAAAEAWLRGSANGVKNRAR